MTFSLCEHKLSLPWFHVNVKCHILTWVRYSVNTARTTPQTGIKIYFLYFCQMDGWISTSSFFLFFFRFPFSRFSNASNSACCLRFSSSLAAFSSFSFISTAFFFSSKQSESHSSETWPSRAALHGNSFLILRQGHRSLTFWTHRTEQLPWWQISLHRCPQDSSFGHWFLHEVRIFFSFSSAKVSFLHSM